jgi:hypothetical protein
MCEMLFAIDLLRTCCGVCLTFYGAMDAAKYALCGILKMTMSNLRSFFLCFVEERILTNSSSILFIPLRKELELFVRRNSRSQ